MGLSVFKALSAQEKVYFASLAIRLNFQNDERKLAFSLSADEKFAELSTIADKRRDVTLAEVFSEFNEGLPSELLRYSDKKTANWHYHNEVIDPKHANECGFQNRGELVDALLALDRSLAGELNKRQKALVLAFLIHLVQDLHQPLHTFTKLRQDCTSDRGGNDTCYRHNIVRSTCRRNLHSEWDRGFGVFKSLNPQPFVAKKATEFDPENWVKEGLAFYDDVYAMDAKDYQKRAKEIAAERVTLAQARLLHYLKKHYGERQRGSE